MAGQYWGKESDSYGTVEGSSWIGLEYHRCVINDSLWNDKVQYKCI